MQALLDVGKFNWPYFSTSISLLDNNVILVSFFRNAELTEQTRNLLRKPSFDNWYVQQIFIDFLLTLLD